MQTPIEGASETDQDHSQELYPFLQNSVGLPSQKHLLLCQLTEFFTGLTLPSSSHSDNTTQSHHALQDDSGEWPSGPQETKGADVSRQHPILRINRRHHPQSVVSGQAVQRLIGRRVHALMPRSE